MARRQAYDVLRANLAASAEIEHALIVIGKYLRDGDASQQRAFLGFIRSCLELTPSNTEVRASSANKLQPPNAKEKYRHG